MWSGICYTRISDGESVFYQAPPLGECVAIKMINKKVVDQYLKRRINATPQDELRNVGNDYISEVINIGACENPYKEMSRMLEIGDNKHVLGCHEFLQDDKHIYMILPHACGPFYSLDKYIYKTPSEDPIPVAEVQNLFKQILNILAYLEERGIHYRDVSPDNFIFLGPNHLVATDLAMSVRIPLDDSSSQRTLIRGMGMFGTCAFMAPEIYRNFRKFDGVAADLWSAVVILYSMLTGIPFYRRPDPMQDVSYRYYVVAEGFAPIAGEIAQDVLEEISDPDIGDPFLQAELAAKERINEVIPPDARKLFYNVFRVNARERWTLAQVMESDFVNRRQDQS
uniref:Protein kinase domain-containing protein n=1 Tax=Entomoneis paludosa TaxID=265537 RepID=A0A7S2YN43_9STRA|mmetsp:Transcript_39551/g.82160  ORF Transcript_39551/g.82160 Transcript_39551/m.82160 type:complete len:339 (+) Transcript_39551:463-1479(+)